LSATYSATEFAAPPGGQLYITVRNTLTFTVPDGSSVWRLLATNPRVPTPSLATQVTSARATVGQSLTDVVTVSGDDGEDGTIEAIRYGPVLPPRSGDCSRVRLASYLAARATHVSARVDGTVNGGNGEVRVTSPPVTAPGCYGWAETLTLRPSGATATSPPTAPHESTLVVRPPTQVRVVPPPPRAPAPPVASPPPHRPDTPAPPELARTGAPIDVGRTALLGAGLVALGVLTVAGSARSERRSRAT
jgi:hypothetical protein